MADIASSTGFQAFFLQQNSGMTPNNMGLNAGIFYWKKY
jgi:hypothetical protein